MQNEFAVVITESEADAIGQAVADGVEKIEKAIKERGTASLVLYNNTALFEALVAKEVDWAKVVVFQLDEFVGCDAGHSSGHHINESLAKLAPVKAFHAISPGPGECERLGALVTQHPIDLCFLSIGSNGQIGLNDPPNLEIGDAYASFALSQACKTDLVSDGVFPADAVPNEVISMSLQQIMKSRQVIAIVTGKRKAAAVKNITEGHSKAVLQKHPDCVAYIDSEAASLLKTELAKNGPPAAAAPNAAPNKGFMIRT